MTNLSSEPRIRARLLLTLISRGPLLAVGLFALLVNVWGLSRNGLGNTYYASAARSMTDSWHNFFFGAFDPGGFITVDKPPVFLWIQASSAWLFGYSSWSLLLPSAIAGTAAVVLLWLVVHRYFGPTAATVASVVLALTPIAVVVNRLNAPETFYILALVGAAVCTLRSLEANHWWTWTTAAGVLVGIAFNTKMLVGWVPGPALALAIVVGVEGPLKSAWRQWLPRMVVLSAVTLVVSASWMLIVDAWPSSDRPYIGGSNNDTVRDLVLGYNGLDRVQGDPGVSLEGASFSPARNLSSGPSGSASLGTGGDIVDETGPLRMFNAANGGQIAWFLPFALLSGLVSLWHGRSQRLVRSAVVLWLGWVLLFGGIFSFSAGTYHSYYTAALAPGIAALVGIGVATFGQLMSRSRVWLIAGAAITLLTLWVQLELSGMADGFFVWVRPLMEMGVLAGLGVLAATTVERRVSATAGLAIVTLGLLFLPAAWSIYETTHVSSSAITAHAGPRNGADGPYTGQAEFDASVPALASWLRTHQDQAARWDLVVPAATFASSLIASEGLSVMAVGGFSGLDPTVTAKEFAKFIATGETRFVLVTRPTRPRSRVGAAAIVSAVRAACEPVTDSILPVKYRDPAQLQLFDCAGRSEQLAR